MQRWFNSDNQFNCPLCRTPIYNGFYHQSSSKNQIQIKYFKLKKVVTDILINNKKYSINISFNIDPCGFLITKKQQIINNNSLSSYILLYNTNDFKITLFTRLSVLYSKQNINFIQKESLDRVKYYETDNLYIVGTITKKNFDILFKWCFDVVKLIINKYKIDCDNEKSIITVIFDIFFKTIVYFKLEDDIYQWQCVISTVIYNIIIFKYKDCKLSLDFLAYLTCNTFTIKQLNIYQSYIKVQLC